MAKVSPRFWFEYFIVGFISFATLAFAAMRISHKADSEGACFKATIDCIEKCKSKSDSGNHLCTKECVRKRGCDSPLTDINRVKMEDRDRRS